nr:hypothetical protein [Tanacetum cinerariifolium]
MGAKQDTSINVRRGPYCYRLHGENYHLVGSLLPQDGKPPKFAQLCIFDTNNEIENRIKAVRNKKLDYQLTKEIRDLLDSISPLVKDFCIAGERIRSSDDKKFKLKLIRTRTRDGRDYNLPTASKVASLIVGDFDATGNKKDIILRCQDEDWKRISELHPQYLAMPYPLFFLYTEDGYRTDIFYDGVTYYNQANKGTRVTMKLYFAYGIQERKNEYSMMLNEGRLFQQFVVDAYTMIKSERVSFNRKNDKELRSETYSKLATFAEKPDYEVKLRGKRLCVIIIFWKLKVYDAELFRCNDDLKILWLPGFIHNLYM